jgi:hypothetical protein
VSVSLYKIVTLICRVAVQTAVLVISAVWQLVHLKSFFLQKKMV